MKNASLLAVALAVLVCGCATHRLTVEVNTGRIDVESPESNGLTSALAADIFRNVANQLGFVVDPKQAGPGFIDYTAHALGPKPTDHTFLTMEIAHKQISFTSELYRDDTSEDFTAAENAATLFEQELDKRHVKYEVTKVRGLLYGLGP